MKLSFLLRDITRGVAIAAFLGLPCGPALHSADAQPHTQAPAHSNSIHLRPPAPTKKKSAPVNRPPYRGWGYLVGLLRAEGISEEELARVYRDPKMPLFGEIPFSVAPRESHALYRGFRDASMIRLSQWFLAQNTTHLSRAEKEYGVTRYLITALLCVETQFGRNTGKFLVINRLSRVVGLADPENVLINYNRLKKDDPTVTLEQVKNRAAYLRETFLPEITALFELARRKQVYLLTLTGSYAGAFGLPQFLPSTFLNYAVDGNRDGRISIFNTADAIFSTANFVKSLGWGETATIEEKRKAVWRYNHSDAYVDSVLDLAETLRAADTRRSTQQQPQNPAAL